MGALPVGGARCRPLSRLRRQLSQRESQEMLYYNESASGTALPLPLGEVALRSNDGEGDSKNRSTATRAQPQRAGARKRCPTDHRLPEKPSAKRECVLRLKSFSVPFFKKEQKPPSYRTLSHASPSGMGRANSMGWPETGWSNARCALWRAMVPLRRLPYLPSPQSGCRREANCTRI